MRGGKLRIQTAAFCLFMFISLFYRRRYCFSGATEKAKGGREGGRSCFAFVGNVRPALLFLHLFFFFSLRPRDFSFLLFLFFTGWPVPLPPLPLFFFFFFFHYFFFFFSPPLCTLATRVVVTDSNARGRSVVHGPREVSLVPYDSFIIPLELLDRFSLMGWDCFLGRVF